MKNFPSVPAGAVVALVVGVSGCESPAEPSQPAAVEVSIGTVSMAFDAASDSLALNIPFTIANTGGVEILSGPCPPVLMRETEDGWQIVYSGACIMERAPTTIRPGARVSGEMVIRTELQENEALFWTPPIDGAYRVRFVLWGRKQKGRWQMMSAPPRSFT